MKRLVLTGNGSTQVSVPLGRRFSLACSGTFGGGTITAQYHTGMTPTEAITASGTLTIGGVVLDGQTVTVDGDIYEFAADVAQTVSGTNIPVDITGVTTASSGNLTLAEQPSVGDTMTIGTTVYTFIADEGTPVLGEIKIGTDLATAKTNIVAAVNGTAPNVAHPLVSMADFVVDEALVTALVGGVAGDLIATTDTFANIGNLFAGGTLGTVDTGADCTAANAVTALVAADAGTTYVLADGAGNTVTVTANTAGVAGNSIATTETMTNGAFGAATLTGGAETTDPLDRFVSFATAAVSLTAAGEKTGTNYGAHNEINLLVTGATNPNIIAIVNLLTD